MRTINAFRKKKFLLCILLNVSSLITFSQSHYLDFIQNDNKIQWAAEYTQIFEITPKIRRYGIKQVLLSQFKRTGCIDNYFLENGEIIKRRYCNMDSIPKTIFTSSFNPYYRTLWGRVIDNNSSFITMEKSCECSGKIPGNKFEMYKLVQTIYYKNANLYVRNILVSPLCLKNVIDSTGELKFTWEGCLSSSAKTETFLAPVDKKKFIDLGSFEQLYNFNYDVFDSNSAAKVLTLKNPLFSHHLFEDILSNKVTVVDERNNIIPSKKVFAYRNPPVEVPVYDNEGNMTKIIKVIPEVNIDSFYDFAINQHFYFDTISNTLHSQINYIDVYRSVITLMGINLGKAKYYRIYFIKPSLYKKENIKRFLQ